MMMLLLVSAVALLVNSAVVSPAAVGPRHSRDDDTLISLKMIFDLAENCSQSLTEDVFVEDVSDLATGKHKCGEKFFCKVQKILHNNNHTFCDSKEKLVRQLKAYHNIRNVQCGSLLHGMATDEVGVSTLLKNVEDCIKYRIFHSPN